MKYLVIILFLSLAFSQTNAKGRYFTYEEVDKIVDDVGLRYEAKITGLSNLIISHNEIVSNLIVKYQEKEAITLQKHELEKKAIEIKLKDSRGLIFFGGVGTGIGLTAGTILLLDSVKFPLFEIKF